MVVEVDFQPSKLLQFTVACWNSKMDLTPSHSVKFLFQGVFNSGETFASIAWPKLIFNVNQRTVLDWLENIYDYDILQNN